MFDIGAGELLLIVIVAVVVIGPKDMPLALRTAGRWIARVRRVSNHFRAGVEAMIREAEMEEMEKKWAAQNEKIMRDHPVDAPPEAEPTGAYPSRPVDVSAEAGTIPAAAEPDEPQLPLGRRK
jgi:sec-independent protein translocase protein TatB